MKIIIAGSREIEKPLYELYHALDASVEVRKRLKELSQKIKDN